MIAGLLLGAATLGKAAPDVYAHFFMTENERRTSLPYPHEVLTDAFLVGDVQRIADDYGVTRQAIGHLLRKWEAA